MNFCAFCDPFPLKMGSDTSKFGTIRKLLVMSTAVGILQNNYLMQKYYFVQLIEDIPLLELTLMCCLYLSPVTIMVTQAWRAKKWESYGCKTPLKCSLLTI